MTVLAGSRKANTPHSFLKRAMKTTKIPTWKTEPKNVLETLRRVRKLLASPSRWHKGSFARDGAGNNIKAISSTAIAWCLWGACDRIDGPFEPEVRNLIKGCLPYEYGRHIPTFNDHPDRKHADILELLDKAIEQTRAMRV